MAAATTIIFIMTCCMMWEEEDTGIFMLSGDADDNTSREESEEYYRQYHCFTIGCEKFLQMIMDEEFARKVLTTNKEWTIDQFMFQIQIQFMFPTRW